MATELGATGPRDPLTLRWTNAASQEDANSQRISISISGIDEESAFELKARTADLDLPFKRVETARLLAKWHHLEGLDLPPVTEKPRILIGQDNCQLIVSREVKEGPTCSPIASRTTLGWVVHGNSGLSKSRVDEFTFHAWNSGADDALHKLVKDSFTLESFGTRPLITKQQSKEDLRAAELLEKTTRRKDDRWETGLLWRDDNFEFPTAASRSSAMRRLHGVERKLAKDDQLAELYSQKISEYMEKGYCRKLSEAEAATTTPRTWYLPHFAVTNPNKPGKIRLVFDAAAKSGGVSLNDVLLPGPDLLRPLTGILANFRKSPVAFGGDIREMFHQVRIRSEDTTSQRFLWRNGNSKNPPDTFEMEVMIFGAVSSPCSAQFVKNKNGAEFQDDMPAAARAIEESHYMDDYLDSANSEQEAITRIHQVINIHSCGGFEMRNWIASSRRVLAAIPAHLRARGEFDLSSSNDLPMERTLGLRWDPNADVFLFRLSSKVKPFQAQAELLTKRRLLSLVMSVFDPLGFLTCFSVTARIILRNVWRAGIGWDDELPASLQQQWTEWYQDLREVTKIRIPRCYFLGRTADNTCELHVFCDASEKAYAAVAYFRSSAMQTVSTAFVASRARVAPLKLVSIPRLELQAAVMASRLAQAIREEQTVNINRTVFWSDSQTVLYWIRTDTFKFRPFVAHRIGEIAELTNVGAWRWLPSKLNVADMATRGVRMTELISDSRWFKAPDFLQAPESDWPSETSTADDRPTPEVLELKSEFVGNVNPSASSGLPDVTRFSSFSRLVRSAAWVLRFIHALKCRRQKCEQNVGDLSAEELAEAERRLIRRCQEDTFAEELSLLRLGRPLHSSSRVIQLSPTIEGGILCACGRTANATALPEEVRRPIILDPKHPFTRLLIHHHHCASGHHGQERVMNELRQRYWVLRMRSAVRQAWHSCQTCKIALSTPKPPQMGPLPSCRLTPYVRAFTFTGVDYFGPMMVTIGRRREKRYGALFTCLTTRAVHLELAASLSTDSAIMAIRRMIARRGTPKEIYSDNGTNFRGADTELKKALRDLDQSRFHQELSSQGIKWVFNPPAAPHMGGSWERLVRSVKAALQVLLKERAPKEEVLHTLLLEAEAIVNSRPLTYVSSDVDDLPSLTPFSLLIGTTSAAHSPGAFTDDDLRLRKQWRAAQRLADLFWKRWIREYLPTLTRRTKWNEHTQPLKIDDCVIVVDDSLPRGCWPRGRVSAVHPGRDGVVRVVDVKTQTGTFRRPVSKLCFIDT